MGNSYEVTLSDRLGNRETHTLNCSSEGAARAICEGLYNDRDIVSVSQVYGHRIAV